jgi:agmatine/peptidylarginine deiminase
MTDTLDNIVFVPAALVRYPETYGPMLSALSMAGITVRNVYDCRNIWLRDWMPVQVNKGFIKFTYRKDFERYPQLVVPECTWRSLFHGVRMSPIVLDGGNIVRHGSTILMTEQVFLDNPGTDRMALLDHLETLLEGEIIPLPVEPDDTLGHADGIVAFADAHTVFVNNYHDPAMKGYTANLKKILHGEGLTTVSFPNAYHRCVHLSKAEFRIRYPFADDYNPGYGYSINYLRIGNLALAPAFGVSEDACTECKLREHIADADVHLIPCSDLSMEGGLLRCVTAQYRL